MEWAEGCATHYRTGVVTGESSLVMFGRGEKFDGTSPGILFFHGVASTALEPITFYTLGATYLPQLANRGFIIVSSLWGSSANWGNAASVTAAAEARTWLLANGAKNGPLGVYGVSHGFMTAANWWDANPTHVGAFVGVVPVANASNGYDDNPTMQAGMNAAYGGDFATNGAPRSPHLILADRAGTPGGFYYSSEDTVIRPTDVTSLAATLGCDATDVEPASPSGHLSWLSSAISQRELIDLFSVLK